MRSTGLVDRRATSPRSPASSASRRKGSGWISGTWLTFAVLAYAALERGLYQGTSARSARRW